MTGKTVYRGFDIEVYREGIKGYKARIYPQGASVCGRSSFVIVDGKEWGLPYHTPLHTGKGAKVNVLATAHAKVDTFLASIEGVAK